MESEPAVWAVEPDGWAEPAWDDAAPGSEQRSAGIRGREGTLDLGRLARRHDGIITLDDALESGMTPEQVRWRVGSGRWQRLGRGVFLTNSGQATWRAHSAASVLAVGSPAALCLESAAAVDGFAEPPAVVHLLVPHTRRVAVPAGSRLHRSAHFGPRTLAVGWPPRTRVEETVLDLVERGTLDDGVAVAARAVQRHLTTADRICAALHQRNRFPHRVTFSLALGHVAAGAESGLEVRYHRDVEGRHGLPASVLQVRDGTGRLRRDFGYVEFRVLVETDGQLGHVGAGRFRDARRDNAALVDGWVVLRYGSWEVAFRPCALAGQVGLVLRRYGWQGMPRPCSPTCMVRDLGALALS